MKTIGLLGGMSWESTTEYYKHINQMVNQRVGALASATCVVYSVNFEEIVQCQKEGRWDDAAKILGEAAERIEKAGADCLLVCTNTMHKIANQISAHSTLPFLHIADATAEKIREKRLQKVGLLGTKFTMEQDFFIEKMKEHGIEIIVPAEKDRDLVHQVIFDELCKGVITQASRHAYQQIMDGLVKAGAEGIILGCTEITLLVDPNDATVPLFDTTRIHAAKAVDFALE
ncbi:aspartate/glutamate racemase family protein [Brevibacillus laterosporus]|uniref:Aspartate/glutamate racemase family protein n=1 Tax=Brevibacillus laterosporus TaxID=1465 RepID=A0A502J0Y8_BRELA|nr:aspartate/glutamate racemase family protein [Brevibacillus laterosporus]QDX92602.1 aspartate/glutamate racemase family protein [Brevibacillus laterosporus]RAP27868.1 Aspartate racemase [Brevibacillus laterosporus]TPG70911.1 aspartate/glutamate racemase family protein [Brevibacillus laterosporus]TPG91652.1 aspartate/glutamate racemase family protein [Brevibacillus laterosporus]